MLVSQVFEIVTITNPVLRCVATQWKSKVISMQIRGYSLFDH